MYVSVHVDAEDVLGQISKADLISELKARDCEAEIFKSFGLHPEVESGAERALWLLRKGEVDEAIVCLERTLFPKFSTADLALKAYAEFKQAQH